VIGPTPFLDFFKRGEVAREVRMLAARGALAPRAHEQLGLLTLLVDDPDAEVRETAERTLNAIPRAVLGAFLARSDVSIGIREFFGDRGVFPDEIPSLDAADGPSAPLVEAPAGADPDPDATPQGEDARLSAPQQVAKMGFTRRLTAAFTGSREMRAVLIRDTNKMIAAAVLSSPRLTDSEIESFARMSNVGEDVLRVIATNRVWTKNYGVVLGLVKNPKTPLAMSMNLMARLGERDLSSLSVDRNVPDSLRIAARKKVMGGKR